MKGISKVIAVVAFIIWLIVMWKASSVFESKQVSIPKTVEKKIPPVTDESDVTPDMFLAAQALLKSPYAAARYQPLDKNMFVKPEPPPEVFTPDKLKVISINPLPLPFMYSGFIEKSDGTIIGQVNWSGKTYFVKKGDKLKDYKVLEINSKILKLENKEGLLLLDYKKPGKSKELVAKLHNLMSDKDIEVRKNDPVGEEYKVLDIKADSVVLYGQNKEWVINKGR